MNSSIRRQWRVFAGVVSMAQGLLICFCSHSQDLFVSDFVSTTLYQFDSQGLQNPFGSGFNGSFGLAFNNIGVLFEADWNSGNVYTVATNGVKSLFASGFSEPAAVAFDRKGNLFVSAYGEARIYEFTNDSGTLNPTPGIFSSIGLSGPIALVFDNTGNLFESDFNSGNIYEFTNYNGALTSNLNLFASSLGNPAGLAFDSSGNLFVAATRSNAVLKITPQKIQTAFVSSSNAWAVAFDAAGNLFVANGNQGSIIKITPDGLQSTFTSALYDPLGLAFQPTAQIQTIATKKTFHLTVSTCSPYFSTILEASTNLNKGIWVPIYTNISSYSYTDSMTATLPYRFYRTVIGR